MTDSEKMDYIRRMLPVEDKLTMLAEEASEVAQAVLKLNRARRGLNPTAVTKEEALSKVKEELSDLILAADVLGEGWQSDPYFRAVREQKLDRWYQRMTTGGAQ